MPLKSPHFEVFERRHLLKTRYYFRFVAGNGEIMFQSEGYTRKDSALQATGRICELFYTHGVIEVVDWTERSERPPDA